MKILLIIAPIAQTAVTIIIIIIIDFILALGFILALKNNNNFTNIKITDLYTIICHDCMLVESKFEKL